MAADIYIVMGWIMSIIINSMFTFYIGGIYCISDLEISEISQIESETTSIVQNDNVNNTDTSVKVMLYDSCTIDSRYKHFHFFIPQSVYDKLVYPHKFDTMRFREFNIVFSHDAFLPDECIYDILLYTYKDNYPLLIKVFTSRYTCFYALDSITNKWNNYHLKWNNATDKEFDRNGVICYSPYIKLRIIDDLNYILKDNYTNISNTSNTTPKNEILHITFI
ncbi:BMN2 family [Babesia microti strain RI]|uniref:BMN2 family n=1 Tax=Babesia microti (strain RI) TaxID=1133968 RepID=A0A1N6LYG5_BABMR|nr:BMN2 family [Babesia microti strain RI]SIO73920.1 BMN2 family [Babesia microti strain RI]|eukprot:XP_012650527.2 BMN2 family [Babesia microti strain RI]